MTEPNLPDNAEILLYGTEDGTVKIDVLYRDESFWLTQKRMAELFGVQRPAITKHIKNIIETRELEEDSVCSILEHTAADGKTYRTQYYNLDAIIAVGYRVNSRQNVGWAKRSVPNKINFDATKTPCNTEDHASLVAAISSRWLPTNANRCYPSRRISVACESPSSGRWKNTPSPSTLLSSFPTTCTQYGPCRKTIPIIQPVGAGSNAISVAVASVRTQRNRLHATISGRSRYGNGASGNTPSVMRMIGKGTWITSITTPSSMATPKVPESGHTARLSDACKEDGTNRIREPRSRKASRESNMNSAPRRLGKAAIAACPTKRPKTAGGGSMVNHGMLGTLRFAQPTWLAEQMQQGEALDARIRENLARVGFWV